MTGTKTHDIHDDEIVEEYDDAVRVQCRICGESFYAQKSEYLA